MFIHVRRISMISATYGMRVTFCISSIAIFISRAARIIDYCHDSYEGYTMSRQSFEIHRSAAAPLAQGNGGFLSLIFFLRGGSPLMFAGEPRSAHKRSCEKPRAAPRPGSEKWVCFGWCFWWRWIFSPPFLVAVDFWWWIFRALLNILKSGAPNDLKKSTAKIHHLSPRAVPAAHTDGRPNGTSSQPWRHRPQPRKARNE